MAEKWESWKTEMSKQSLDELAWLGHFGPTIGCDRIKGYMDQGETYLDAKECEEIGNALLEASKWLREKGNQGPD